VSGGRRQRGAPAGSLSLRGRNALRGGRHSGSWAVVLHRSECPRQLGWVALTGPVSALLTLPLLDQAQHPQPCLRLQGWPTWRRGCPTTRSEVREGGSGRQAAASLRAACCSGTGAGSQRAAASIRRLPVASLLGCLPKPTPHHSKHSNHNASRLPALRRSLPRRRPVAHVLCAGRPRRVVGRRAAAPGGRPGGRAFLQRAGGRCGGGDPAVPA
jgi:hypothetical protein